mmetsp:Transcript_31669/g.54796  ORF Transcript_31669/g.54796 Transcript_31669/m.54796 type:complete len:217 (+) Transcript_31669:310-960(+)
MTLLALLKVLYPSRVTLLRGNHETRGVTQVFGFFAECQRKYGDPTVWTYFTEAFDYLPIAALIDDTYFCVHGGLSPSVSLIDDIRQLTRIREIPHEGAFSDLVWSDPEETTPGFAVSARGAGFLFGGDVVERFLHLNGIEHIMRAHQLCDAGYQELFQKTLSTVWSAPNYCYRFGNSASILQIDEHLGREFVVFQDAPENSRQGKTFEGNTENLQI